MIFRIYNTTMWVYKNDGNFSVIHSSKIFIQISNVSLREFYAEWQQEEVITKKKKTRAQD